MEKQWIIWHDEANQIIELQKELKVSETICSLLVKRGITNYADAENYFRPKFEHLHDAFLMKDMQIAVDRILLAIQNNENILIYGDYDVDGTSAVAVVFDFFKNFYSNIAYYIPHRFKEGYGVSEAGIQHAIDTNVQLIITVDCGIKSAALIAKAKQNNIDVIICDHHLPDEENLPQAIAILNPKQHDCNYPYDELCGCAIGFKLICALEQTMFAEQNLCYANLDLVATAIAADIVPITGENRTLAFLGLHKANTNPTIAIQSLKICADLEKEFTISDLVFIVAPRINAAGRMDVASTAVELFLSKNLNEANKIAQLLNINNADRKDTDRQTTEEALAMLQEQSKEMQCTILYKPDWHKGVVGIVASRLIENKYQPTIVLTDSDNKISGSARSIDGLNLFEALNACGNYLTTYGGHYYAAGLTLNKENLEPFKIAFNNYVKNTLHPQDFIPKLHIDAELKFEEINANFYNIINQMQPFGPQNLRPVFISKNVYNYQNNSRVVKEKHVKFELIQNNKTILKGIGFGLANKLDLLLQNAPLNIVYTLQINEFRGVANIEMQVLDFDLT